MKGDFMANESYKYVYKSIYEIRKEYIELLQLRRRLSNICGTISKEIMQSDVEWMNLDVLAQKSIGAKAAKAPEKPNILPTKPKELMDTSNLPKLNLNPQIGFDNKTNPDEEFDSD